MSTEDVRAAFEAPERIEPIDDGGQPPRTPDGGEGPPPEDPVDPIWQASQQTENDVGNAARFCIHFGDDLMYVPRVGWFTWTGSVWSPDPDELEVRRRAQEIGPLILEELDFLRLSDWDMDLLTEEQDVRPRIRAIEDVPVKDRSEEQKTEHRDLSLKLTRIEEAKARLRKRRDRRRTLGRNAGNSGPIKNMIAESQTSLAVPLEDLDAAPFDVNCLSGVVRSTVAEETSDDGRTFRYARIELVPHARDHRLTKIMPVTYDAEATASRFEAFLTRILPDPDIRAFLQRWFGVAMTAEPLQHMVFLYGSGANGKSVLVDIISRVLGEYAATARIESLTGTNRRGGGDATPDLIPLIGARLVRTSEPDAGAKLQEGLIKELTGGEPIMVRALHSDFVEVHPVFKLTMSGNHKPDIRGTDDGIWRRFLMVPFTEQIPEKDRDPHLVDKLWFERDGIFQWLIEGLNAFREMGLSPPEAVVSATAEFRAEQDPVGDFLTICCRVTGDPADNMPARDLVEAFRYWQMTNGVTPWAGNTVSKRLADKVDRWRHPRTQMTFAKRKLSTINYVGIQLNDMFAREFRDAPRDHKGQVLAPSTATPDPDQGGNWD